MRERLEITEECSGSLHFLYRTIVGRIVLKLLVLPAFSKLGGKVLSSGSSKKYIEKFIKNNKIDMSDYPQRDYKSFNDFFTREIIPEKRPISKEGLISPCDGWVSAYRINKSSRFHIKGRDYSVNEILSCDDFLPQLEGGTCLIFRLTVKDYHHYCHIADGKMLFRYFKKGKLHTVQPIACRDNDIYKENSREFTVINSKELGRYIQMEVGAMLVGKISNNNEPVIRGAEKGKFEFGGSTIVVFLEKGAAKLDDELWKNTGEGFETRVRYGEKIGEITYVGELLNSSLQLTV